ncbi:MAG TPA: D-Ala-D-Ala carboxypeptidase family metallohydrolase [Pararhizobium sp.]|uniref:YcbK family protein n=1 Tax=Pararhizobium sp. TaxID=1977563 RepID=UPI002C1F1379|nr:D-Ala-D-Ala carboxypeptidase family metallohydrolase [Pararhizobium sp.]HTO33922.1 D-Ala-D-Ala carboxypeptidase family metallohydrolase [Pararhizobium sp.]
MHTVFSIALACLLTLSFSTPAQTRDGKPRKVRLPVHSLSVAYAVQTASVKTGCFSPRLRAILAHIAAKTGRRPLVTSGHRPRAHRTGSLHRLCQAADIRVPGLSDRGIIAAARTAPGIGGVGRYCNGIVHVDTGPKRQWAHCRRKGGGILNARRRAGKRA